MPKKPDLFDLRHEGVRALIELTNSQFKDWQESLAAETDTEIKSGSLMNYWFILSNLALHGDDDFRMNKKDAFSTIPNLSTDSVRKYVATLGALGLVETVKVKNQIYLRLAPGGQRAVARTMTRWIDEFGALQKKHF